MRAGATEILAQFSGTPTYDTNAPTNGCVVASIAIMQAASCVPFTSAVALTAEGQAWLDAPSSALARLREDDAAADRGAARRSAQAPVRGKLVEDVQRVRRQVVVDELAVIWPDGSRSAFQDVTARQVLTVTRD